MKRSGFLLFVSLFVIAVSTGEKSERVYYVEKPKVYQFTPYGIDIDLSGLISGGQQLLQLHQQQQQQKQPQKSTDKADKVDNKKTQNNFDLGNLLSFLPQLTPPVAPFVHPQQQQQPQRIVNAPQQQQQGPPHKVPAPLPKAPPPRGRTLLVDVCYYLGDDVLNSYVPHVPVGDKKPDPDKVGQQHFEKYIKVLNQKAEDVLNTLSPHTAQNNNAYRFKLIPQGPWPRLDRENRYPDPAAVKEDVKESAQFCCDIDIFLVFNKFDPAKQEETEKQAFAGVIEGQACNANKGKGFALVVDRKYRVGRKDWQ